ncbi:hypothetical protein CXG81DRAFT_27389 [Caulochytrium protostelioides]|uniref:Uncharacterized protein n=1 Tax=Caulochytrium protostelioides TaxID=1555241 RepID=A0A4P9X4C3_9FUNG|nr:hypothetical protein CXG81DRAFT_27389 [Caulochytrium protostelioides]|eukprot:RKO99881.1 hypothetical protein CXG81DRAFT_27389 [Caulochytrium protostelioides]
MAPPKATKGNETLGRGAPDVFANAVQAESLRKEMRHFTLRQEFELSPQGQKALMVTDKPTVVTPQALLAAAAQAQALALATPTAPADGASATGASDEALLHAIHYATTSGQYGAGAHVQPVRHRMTASLTPFVPPRSAVEASRDDRFHHPKAVTEITKIYGLSFVKDQSAKSTART